MKTTSELFADKDPPYTEEVEAFGENWCGPKNYRSHEENMIAVFRKEHKGDGQTVKVFCLPMPARFYRLKVMAGKNSIGEPKSAYEVGTGSGCHQLAADMAKAISQGMVGFHPETRSKKK